MRRRWTCHAFGTFAGTLASLLLVQDGRADADVRFTSALTADASVASREGSDITEKDERTFELRPSIGVVRRGPDLSLTASGSIRLARNDVANDEIIEPELLLGAVYAPSERGTRVILDVSSRYRDLSVLVSDSDEPGLGSSDDLSRLDSLSFSPSFGVNIGSRHRLDTAYRYSVVRTNDDTDPGTDTHSAGFRSRSALFRDRRLSTSFQLDANRAGEPGGRSASSALATAGLDYEFANRLGVSGLAGYDRVRVNRSGAMTDAADAEVLRAADVDEQGAVWGVALRWNPESVFSANVAWVERSFGHSPSASIRLQGRRSRLELAWSRTLSFAKGSHLLLAEDRRAPIVVVSDQDTSLQGFEEQQPVGGSSYTLLARDLDSTEELLSLQYAVAGKVSQFIASIEQTRRDSLQAGDQERLGTAFGLAFERSLGRRTTWGAGVRHIRQRDRTGSASASAGDGSVEDGTDRFRRTVTRIGLSVRFELL